MHSKLASSLCSFLLVALAVTPVRADVLSLDGNGAYVTFPATGIPSGNAPFTIEVWINPTSIPTGGQNGGQMTFWGNETGNQANGFRLRGTNGVRHFFWSNDHDENLNQDVLADNSGPGFNGWHHFAITWDGTATRWYWNGAPLGNPLTAGAGVNVQPVNHRMGARLGGEFFNGYMDELRIWNVARSAAEIAANFQQELTSDESGLVAYWNFEGNLVDRAGGNNNGTAVGNAVIAPGINAPVMPPGPRIYSFAASTNQILLAQSVTLSWAVSNALSTVIDQGIGTVSPSNSIVLTPSITTTYKLTTTNNNGARTAMVTVMVDPGIPVASNFSTNTPYNTSVAITLRGTDPQGSNLTYSIVMPPAHGSLSGTPPNVTYLPATNYGGLDSFTFKVNDGMFDSAPGTISLNVVPPPLPPSGIVLSTTNIPSSAGPGAFIAALQAIDINNLYGDSHTFGLVGGYGDNAKFAVSGSSLLAGAAFAGGLGATFSIRLRAIDSTSQSTTQDFILIVFDAPRSVVINEIHYNPDFNPVRESFIELYNDTDSALDLSQWRVRGGVDYFFPSGTTLGPRAFAVVAEDPATILLRYGRTVFGPWSGGLNNEGENLTLRDANGNKIDEVDFKSEFPWPISPDGSGLSAQLIHPSLDNNLGGSWRGGLPTPGATNSVFATNAAPQIRQVDHSPKTPATTNQVVITAKVTDPDGVASVTLAYQVVAPGNYLPATLPLTTAQLINLNLTPTLTNSLNAAFEASSNWVSAAMHDDGLNGDEAAGDGIYSVVLPQQANRSLVRYRITCADLLGATRRAPFEDDPSLNFAYFVYDGIPSYLTFPSATLQTLPVYSLITRDADLNLCAAWFNTGDQLTSQTGTDGRISQGRLHFNWEGAVVYDGVVYDHVNYRLRGANGRYHPGKRSFRIRFNSGRYLDAKDNSGRRFPTKWRELTTGKGQSNHGGEQFALNEVVNFFLFNKVGVPAPETFYFHFRVIRGASEQGANQYSGDFWGLNWGQEKYDVNFLDAHSLPKGNLYKLVDNFVLGAEELRYQGAFATTNSEDFFNIENNLDGFKSIDWLNAHANYTNWYRYFTIAKAIRHYDTWPSANKNGAWYFEPRYGVSNSFLGRMMQLPYDTTDTWGATWNNGDDVLFNGIFASTALGGDSGQHPEMQLEYRNMVREMRTLIFQPEQIYPIIDAFAGVIAPFAPADHTRWSNAPSPASYQAMLATLPGGSPGLYGGLPAYQQDMKNFMFVGGNNAWWTDRTSVGAGGWVTILDTDSADAAIPIRPAITYQGTNGFPIDGLVFQSSAFSDPQGAGTFAAMQWRIAEVLTPGTVVSNPAQLRLEWDAAWTSPELTPFNSLITVPDYVVTPDLLYRARVRHKDDTGRWSQWSLPVEFRPSPRDTVSQLRTNLVFSEIMYNPPGEGATDGDEFEFIELQNIGPFTLNLGGLFFSSGVTFNFTNGTTLAPGATFLLARNPAVFATRYPGVTVNGDYSDKLNNDGETVTISHLIAGEIISISYADRAPWPVTPDGFGFSLVRAPDGTYQGSSAVFGTPGVPGGATSLGGVVVNEALSGSTLPLKDTIELLNIAATNVDISGWWLSDDPTLPQKFRIPARPPLAPGEFALFTEDEFNPTPGYGVSFSLSSLGDDTYLFSADAAGNLTGYSHGFTFGAAQDGVAFGRYLNSVGEEQFPPQILRTFNAINSGPRVGPVVLSEIHYHPRDPLDQFLELRNRTGTALQLFDPANPTNTWRVNGLGYTLPSGVILPANGCLLLVSDNTNAFRARWGVPASIALLQYPGNLQDSGERLELQAPDLPTTNGVPYYAVDTVRYNDRKPWPLAADGAGASLQRVDIAAYGDDPVNWLAATPTPGTHGVSGTPPTITSQPASRTNGTTTTATLSVGATGTAPLFYQWRANGGNLDGATNSTLLLANLQLADSGTYQAVVFNSAGSTDSSNALLVVRPSLIITGQPAIVEVRVKPDPSADAIPGTNASFSVSVITANPPLSYQWRLNGALLAPSAKYTGLSQPTLTVNNVTVDDYGDYSCTVSDGVGAIHSSSAKLYPLVRPSILINPATQTVPALSPVAASVVLSNGFPPPFYYYWFRGSSNFTSGVSNSKTNFIVIPGQIVSNFASQAYTVRVTNRAAASFILSNSANFILSTIADTDLDGMPDSYELLYSGSNTDFAPGLDADGDRMSNLAEYLAGTDPSDPNSYLRIDQTTVAGTASVNFAALSNKTYTVQFTDVLPAASWQKLADVVSRPFNRVEVMTDPGWTTNRFYRVVTPRQP